eukprot:s320_g3.t1
MLTPSNFCLQGTILNVPLTLQDCRFKDSETCTFNIISYFFELLKTQLCSDFQYVLFGAFESSAPMEWTVPSKKRLQTKTRSSSLKNILLGPLE